jgi:hypothetical protein
MDITLKPKTPTGPATVATGLSAWLGGVAFCIGFGIDAPIWVAGALTVLSLAFARLGARDGRRGGLTVPDAGSRNADVEPSDAGGRRATRARLDR